MNFKGRSLAVLCGVLLLGGCGEVNESPTLPGPVQVDPTAFVSAQEYRFTPGSVLETTSLRLDYVNPRFDNGIPVRTNPLQGSGEARIANVEARILPVNEIPASELTIDSTLRSSTLAIQIGRTTPLVNITAFGPNDGRLSTQFSIAGLVAISTNPNDQRIRVNTTFRAASEGTVLTLTVRRILVSRNGNQVVLEGDSSLIVPTVGVLFENGGPGPGGEILAPGSFVNPPPPQGPVVAILQTGSFSASFVVRQRGVAGDGTPEDALALFARLNFRPNQAEIVYRPAQVGTQSVLFAPDPTRPNILPNQLVRIRRLLNGRVQAEFDPANTSTVLNFVQVSPPPRPFPTPIPQLPVPTPRPGAPTAFDYFFSLRTERSTGTLPGSPVEGTNPDPVILQGIVPATGDFVFRTLAGAQLAGPFNRRDIGGGVQRGNLNLIFDSTTSADRISGQWFLEQEFPTGNVEGGTADEPGNAPSQEGAILIIRGFFEGTEVRL